MHFYLRLLLGALLFFVVTGPIVQAQEVPSPEARDLLAAGDRLADEGKYDEALISYKNAYEKLVPLVRKLDFKEPVQPKLMRRSELRNYMVQEFQTEYTPEELTLLDRSVKAFGMASLDLDVRELLVNLFTEEVGGFYNPRTKEMYLIREELKKGSFLSRLFAGPEFNPEEQRITLSHEMTHALADQHFDLQGLDKAAAGNDDMLMAISALIEGEATLVMMSELLGEPSLDVTQIEPERIDVAFRLMNYAAPILGGRTMRNAPSIFRDSLIFPYHQGCLFVVRLAKRDGWEGVNEAFRQPPVSTEQILHWEKYAVNRDDPTAIELPQLSEALGEQWKSLGENTLGEFQTAILFDPLPETNVAAEGWDGDRYAIFENAEGRLATVWYTTWDSAADAREFAGSAAPWFSRVVHQHATGESNREALGAISAAVADSWKPAEENARFEKQFHDRSVYIEVRGADAIVVSGFGRDETARAAELLWHSQKAPVTLRR